MHQILADVRAFHQACDIPILPAPTVPDRDRVDLRESLLQEEFDEFMRASAAGDVVEIADALADIIYICVGTALEYGIPLDRVWAEVQRSNMAKVDPESGKVRRRSDGKIMKPPGWTGPNVAAALDVDNTQ